MLPLNDDPLPPKKSKPSPVAETKFWLSKFPFQVFVCGLVQAFAKRVNPPPIKGDKGSSSGTKRYTAKAFVEMIAKCQSLPESDRNLGLAIAVSSDGPITITTVKSVDATGIVDKLETVLFEPYEK